MRTLLRLKGIMGRLLTAVLLIVATLRAATATASDITGRIIDKETGDGIVQATVQLLSTDSVFVAGTLTDDRGAFTLTVNDEGRYILRITSIGYKASTRALRVKSGDNTKLGTISLTADAVMLKETTVVAQAAKVTLVEDTFIYNASAYRVPEGSVVEELVKKLPGAQVDDEGNVTINGKEVKKILVDGKEFMTGDTKTAMKNLPTSIIEKVKAYDEQSDLARITGIDDGEEQTVLDFGIKKGMNRGMLGNVDLSVGTHSRYSEKLMGGLFTDATKVMLLGSANNTNDMGFPGGGGGGRFGAGRQGLNSAKMVGVNFTHEKTKKLDMNGSVRWNHSDGDARTVESSESFLGSTTSSFGNSLSQNYTRSDSWDARMKIEWKPDTLTNIIFRPTFSYSTSDGNSSSSTASFDADPYLYVSDPLDDESISLLDEQGNVVNTQTQRTITYSDSKSAGATLQVNRKLSSTGRNITLRGELSYSDGDSKSLSLTDVHLYQVENAAGGDSTYQTNRYNVAPTKSYSCALQATYSEPLWTGVYLQFSYKFTYKRNKSDRSTYDFSDFDNAAFSSLNSSLYRGWGDYLGLLDYDLSEYLDDDLSRYSEYKNYIHDLQLMMRINRSKYRLNFGVMVQPQTTKFEQQYQGVHVDTTRNVTNISPTLDFRYRFSKVSNLRINYRGTTEQPSMTDLLDIRDDSDPLNITTGNPGLKPSFTNTLRLFYNTFIEKHQQTLMTYINYSNTRNAISNMVTYDETTGGSTTRPENINGNWDIKAAFMYNTALDSAANWNVNTYTDLGYNNYVGYLSEDNATSQKNTTRTTSIAERLSGSWRNSWLEIALDGSFTYTHTRNLLQSENDLDTWQFAYGGSLNLTAPWGTSLSTDIHNNCRRGYNDASMNTNELVWNAQLSQGFLKGKALTISVQLYDILHKQSNFSRTISSTKRSDTSYNSINSYAMVHAIYRFNAFGDKNTRREMREHGDGRPPMGGDGPGMGGPPPDGGGGGPGGGGPGGGHGGGGMGGGFGGPR